jgi:hypothetical protein
MGRTLRYLLPAELDDAGRNTELVRLFCKYYQRYPKAAGWLEDVYPDELGGPDRKHGQGAQGLLRRDRTEEIVMTQRPTTLRGDRNPVPAAWQAGHV